MTTLQTKQQMADNRWPRYKHNSWWRTLDDQSFIVHRSMSKEMTEHFTVGNLRACIFSRSLFGCLGFWHKEDSLSCLKNDRDQIKHTHIHTYEYTRTHTLTHTCTHTLTHTHARTHLHTRTHTLTHMHTHDSRCWYRCCYGEIIVWKKCKVSHIAILKRLIRMRVLF